MQIIKVKQQGDGYLLNDNISVPNAPGNRHYQMIQEWLAIEGNNLEPEYTPDELVIKEAQDERRAKEELADKMQNAGKEVIKEFHILNQGKQVTLEQAQQNAQVFASIKLYLDSGSSFSRDLIASVDLTGTSLSEDDRADLLNVWDSAIA